MTPLLVVMLTLAFSAATPPGAGKSRDVFVREQSLEGMSGVERLRTELVLGRPGAEARLRAWMLASPGADSAARAEAALAICALCLREQRFGEALETCRQGEQLAPGSASGVLGLLEALAGVPPPSWKSTGTLLELRDRRVAVVGGGHSVRALVDTGAEIAIASRAAARSLGGRRVGGTARLETTTDPVAGDLVVFPRLLIGGAELCNLAAVVLPDEQMAYTGESLVLGLSVLVGMRRAAFLDHGARLALGTAVPALPGDTTALYWDEAGVGFAVDFGSRRRAVHFDTGARRTYLFPAALEVLSAEERRTRSARVRRIGGVGGERREQGSRLRNVRLRVGRAHWLHRTLDMAERDENGESARIGFDFVRRFERVGLDFESMVLVLARSGRGDTHLTPREAPP